jgi:hypothetical protein
VVGGPVPPYTRRLRFPLLERRRPTTLASVYVPLTKANWHPRIVAHPARAAAPEIIEASAASETRISGGSQVRVIDSSGDVAPPRSAALGPGSAMGFAGLPRYRAVEIGAPHWTSPRIAAPIAVAAPPHSSAPVARAAPITAPVMRSSGGTSYRR